MMTPSARKNNTYSTGAPFQNFIGSMIASRFRWSQNSRKSSRSAAMCMLAGTPMVTYAENISAPVCMAR